MNILKKTYCRIYQNIFKLILPILPYRNPNQISDINNLYKELKEKNINKVLIITDENINKMGLLKDLEKSFYKHQINYLIYDKTVINPSTDNVEEARTIYLNNNCEALIGFGGGSSIDCAKAVGARVVRPKKPLYKMKGILKIRKKLPLLIAIPTTAGTGSETTLTAVITDSSTRHKYPINDFPLIPDYAVLDPRLIKSLPSFLTATTGMDALTHAIEAYIGNSTTKETREKSINAIKLIFDNLEKSYIEGNDIDAREKMLHAAFDAGMAFTRSYVGYCHAVAHSLGGKYNIPHGLANAILLPYVLEKYGSSIYKKMKEIALELNLVDDKTSSKEATLLLIKKIRTMNSNMKIGTKISDIKKEDIFMLSKYADKEANPLYPVPKLFDAKELESIYYDVMEV